MIKWLYFRQNAGGINGDNGRISAHGTSNSTLRTSACLRYDNLQAIIPFDEDSDEYPNGGAGGDYTGVVMIFKSANTPNGTNFITGDGNIDTNYLQTDRIYLEVQSDSLTACNSIIDYIENTESNYIVINDAVSLVTIPGVIACKFIEVPNNYKN